MSKVKRYNCEIGEGDYSAQSAKVVADKEGRWVEYKAYEEREKELLQLLTDAYALLEGSHYNYTRLWHEMRGAFNKKYEKLVYGQPLLKK